MSEILTIIIASTVTFIFGTFIENPIKKRLDEKSKNRNQLRNQRREFEAVYKKMPNLIDEIRNDLTDEPLFREFIILHKGTLYGSKIHYYFYEDHDNLKDKLIYLENKGLIVNSAFNDVPRFKLTEELVEMLDKHYIKVK